jgi:seryl-tRNA synthetase
MLDPKFLRENIELVRQGVARKKFQVDLDAVLAADEARRLALAAQGMVGAPDRRGKVAIGFIDDDEVGQFHDAALDSLKFIAASR